MIFLFITIKISENIRVNSKNFIILFFIYEINKMNHM